MRIPCSSCIVPFQDANSILQGGESLGRTRAQTKRKSGGGSPVKASPSPKKSPKKKAALKKEGTMAVTAKVLTGILLRAHQSHTLLRVHTLHNTHKYTHAHTQYTRAHTHNINWCFYVFVV